jgi:hypothetical protein
MTTADERFDHIDASIERLAGYILDLREETRTGMQALNSRMDVLSAVLTGIDSRLPALTKSVIESGAFCSQLLREQSRQKAGFASAWKSSNRRFQTPGTSGLTAAKSPCEAERYSRSTTGSPQKPTRSAISSSDWYARRSWSTFGWIAES